MLHDKCWVSHDKSPGICLKLEKSWCTLQSPKHSGGFSWLNNVNTAALAQTRWSHFICRPWLHLLKFISCRSHGGEADGVIYSAAKTVSTPLLRNAAHKNTTASSESINSSKWSHPSCSFRSHTTNGNFILTVAYLKCHPFFPNRWWNI